MIGEQYATCAINFPVKYVDFHQIGCNFQVAKTLDCARATKTIVCSNYSGVIIFSFLLQFANEILGFLYDIMIFCSFVPLSCSTTTSKIFAELYLFHAVMCYVYKTRHTIRFVLEIIA